MDITFKHGITYEVVEPVSVDDLVKSLEANARLISAAGELLSAVVPGLKVATRKVSVVHLGQQSPLKEVFAAVMFMEYQDQLNESVPAIVEAITGAAVPEDYKALLTFMVLILAVYGADHAFGALFPKKPAKALEVEKVKLVNRVAKIIGVSADRIAQAAEVLVTGKSRRSIITAAQKTFAPTRGQEGAAISDTNGNLLISPEATREAQSASGIPFDAPDEDAKNTEVDFNSEVRIVLHAADIDRKRQGWAGHCPDLFDKRVPMHLTKSINPKDIFGLSEIIGDILLTYEENDDGQMEPKEFLLLRVS